MYSENSPFTQNNTKWQNFTKAKHIHKEWTENMYGKFNVKRFAEQFASNVALSFKIEREN